jgi:DNA-binding response OmpR family regulator
MSIQVLVVEDSEALRGWLARVLQQGGCTVTQAEGGEQALTLLRQTGATRAPFDVVLSDIVMGGVGGVEVMQAARGQPEPSEVILLTSNGTLDTAAAAVRLGAFDYLLKPVRPAVLLERVEAAANQRATRRRQADEAAAWRAVAQVMRQVQPNPEGDTGAAALEAKTRPPDRYQAVGPLRLDTQRRELWIAGTQVGVTPIEYTILSVLAAQPGVVLTYGALAQRTHGATLGEREAYGLLRTHMRNLRRKIGREYLVSVRGVGYMVDVGGSHADQDDDADTLVR